MIDKKSMRRQYEEQVHPMGVYMITSKKSDIRYIGSSLNVPQTKTTLFFRLSVGAMASYPQLQDLFKKEGETAINFEVLEFLDKHTSLEERDKQLAILKQLYFEQYKEAKEIRV